jgi:hypothetical protein
MRSHLVRVALALVTLEVAGSAAKAQTSGELAASDAFLFSPTALPPLVLERKAKNEIFVRYGAWAYFRSDPVRSNVGLTISHPSVSEWRSAFTVGHLSSACRQCVSWVVGVVDMERPMTSFTDLRVTLGFGHPLEWSTSSSTSVALSVPSQWRWRDLVASLQPGVALAGVAAERETARSVRPTLGAVIGWKRRRLRLLVGVQAVALHGSAPVYGAALGWTTRSK